mgnify:CR=1 FL=1
MNDYEQELKLYDAKEIQDLLLNIGTPTNLKGFRYITYAVQLILANPDTATIKIVDGLYVDVAKKYNTTASSVERGIRHAIGVTWTNGNLEYIYKLFRNSINPLKGSPTNTQFIMRLYYYFATQ